MQARPEAARRLFLQADAPQGKQEPRHVGPLVDLVLQLVLGAVVGRTPLPNPAKTDRIYSLDLEMLILLALTRPFLVS